MQLQKLIEATEIKTIIWIDDEFSEFSDHSNNEVEVKQHIEAVLELDEPEHTRELFNDLGIKRDPELNAQEHIDELDEWFSGIDKVKINEFAKHHNLQKTDLDKMTDFLKEVDYVNVLTLSFKDWDERKEEILKSQDRKLFLVDKEFEKEGLDKNTGFEIIKVIHSAEGLSKLNQCVLFTHKVTNDFDEEDKARQEYLNTINEELSGQSLLKPPAFMVMSKARINGSDFLAIEQGLHSIFIRKTLYSIAVGLAEEAERSSEATIEKLMKANMVNADKVFFESTRVEGISEVELLHRILASEWKKSLYSYSLKENSLSDLILQGRKISAIREEGEGLAVASQNMELFHDLRKGEIWLESDVLNKNHLPIRCGDVFQINHSKSIGETSEVIESLFILIAPPCELMIRKEGGRKLKDAVLLPIREKTNCSKKDFERYNSSHANFVFKEIERSKSIYIVDLSNSLSINLSALDVCSFNDSGFMHMDIETYIEEHMVPVGSYKRFNAMKEIFKKSDVEILKTSALGRLFNSPVPLLNDPDPVTLTSIEFGNDFLKAPVQRVKRLTDPLAEQVLNAFYAHRARKAMEYDFTG